MSQIIIYTTNCIFFRLHQLPHLPHFTPIQPFSLLQVVEQKEDSLLEALESWEPSRKGEYWCLFQISFKDILPFTLLVLSHL